MKIRSANISDHEAIIRIWEESVRATHHFLEEGYIETLKPRILHEYLPVVDLFVIEDASGQISGFIGVAEKNIEMLFIDPAHFRMGLGKELMAFAINQLGANKVDVNEQNPDARHFYESIGFKVVNRSPVDGQGAPYPILHMAL